MLKKLVHFNSGVTTASFTENEDGSISKKALILASGEWTDNKGRVHAFSEDRIVKIAENSNNALDSGIRIPIAKEHGKTIDDLVGDVNDSFIVKEITEEDLPNKKSKNLIGKLGIFCDDMLIRSKEVVDKVKANLVRELSPGIDIVADKIKEISLVGHPAIPGMSLFNDGSMNELQGIYTLSEAEAVSQDEDSLKEEFIELSCKFFKVMTNILQAPDEEMGDQAQELIEQAFADYEQRTRDLLGIEEQIPDEDEMVSQVNGGMPYSLQQSPNMVAPYSLYDVDTADFAFGQEWLKKQAKGYVGGLRRVRAVGKNAISGEWGKAGQKLQNYFTKPTLTRTVGSVGLDGKLNRPTEVLERGMRWGRVGKTVGAVGATGVAGVGAYKLGQAGLRSVGIGRKERENPAPWYRFGR